MLARLTLALAFLAANVVAQQAIYGQCESFSSSSHFGDYLLSFSSPPRRRYELEGRNVLPVGL